MAVPAMSNYGRDAHATEMNFKTTLVLIFLLAVAAGALYFTRDKGGGGESDSSTASKSAQKVFDVSESDVNKLAVTSSDGKKLVVEKADGKWRLAEPVHAPAEAFEVDSLVRSVADLQARSQARADAKDTGLDKPRYTVDVNAGNGKTYTLLVGD